MSQKLNICLGVQDSDNLKHLLCGFILHGINRVGTWCGAWTATHTHTETCTHTDGSFLLSCVLLHSPVPMGCMRAPITHTIAQIRESCWYWRLYGGAKSMCWLALALRCPRHSTGTTGVVSKVGRETFFWTFEFPVIHVPCQLWSWLTTATHPPGLGSSSELSRPSLEPWGSEVISLPRQTWWSILYLSQTLRSKVLSPCSSEGLFQGFGTMCRSSLHALCVRAACC